MLKKTKFIQGYYKPKNPHKWVITNEGLAQGKGIFYRSSWEKKIMNFFDLNSDFIKVSSEPFSIPYISIDNKVHNYYIDFFVETKATKFLVEIKPYSQTIPPKKPRNNNPKSEENYYKALQTYNINIAKWKACREFCEKQNPKWEFLIITEKILQI